MATNYFELWDLEAGNLIGAYSSEALAFATVRDGVRADGAELWQAVGLRIAGEEPGNSQHIAEGQELIELALTASDIDTRQIAEPTAPLLEGVRESEGQLYINLPDMAIVAPGHVRVTIEDGVITAQVRRVQDETTSLAEIDTITPHARRI